MRAQSATEVVGEAPQHGIQFVDGIYKPYATVSLSQRFQLLFEFQHLLVLNACVICMDYDTQEI
jgi:hypothetical protein